MEQDQRYSEHISTIINSTLFYLLQTSAAQVKAATDLQSLGRSYIEAKIISPTELTNLFTHYMANIPLFNGVTLTLASEDEKSYVVTAQYEKDSKQYIMPTDFFTIVRHSEGATAFANWLEQVVHLVIATRLAVDGAIEEEEIMATLTTPVETLQQLNAQMLALYRASDTTQRQVIKMLRADLFEIEFVLQEDSEWQSMVVAFQQQLLALELEEAPALKAQIAMLRLVTTLLQ